MTNGSRKTKPWNTKCEEMKYFEPYRDYFSRDKVKICGLKFKVYLADIETWPNIFSQHFENISVVDAVASEHVMILQKIPVGRDMISIRHHISTGIVTIQGEEEGLLSIENDVNTLFTKYKLEKGITSEILESVINTTMGDENHCDVNDISSQEVDDSISLFSTQDESEHATNVKAVLLPPHTPTSTPTNTINRNREKRMEVLNGKYRSPNIYQKLDKLDAIEDTMVSSQLSNNSLFEQFLNKLDSIQLVVNNNSEALKK